MLPPPTRARSLRTDSRGAVMVIAVFMAMIAIGSLYYMVGLGSAMVAQERMQDAADATAFSSAVIHARGMNLIALFNIIMASLLAILVLFSLLASLFAYAAQLAAWGALFFVFLGGAVGPLRSASTSFDKLEQVSRPGVMKSIKLLSGMQTPLSHAIPVMANLNALSMSRSSYAPVVQGALTFPILGGLPVVKGKFEKTCEKAGSYVGELIDFPLQGVMQTLPEGRARSWLRKKISWGTNKLATAYARFYCGKGKMPKMPSTQMPTYFPELDTEEYRSCIQENDGDACETAVKQHNYLAGAYDADTGVCTVRSSESEGRIAGVEQVCSAHVKKARDACHISNGTPKKYSWSERTYIRRYRVIGKGPKRRVAEVTLAKSQKNYQGTTHLADEKSSKQRPCPIVFDAIYGNTATISGRELTLWNQKADGKPVCKNKIETPSLSDFEEEGTATIDVEAYEVTDILNCVKNREVKAKLEGKRLDAKHKKEMPPREMCNCAALGEDLFQVRSIVYGDASTLTASADQLILVASDGRAPESSTIGKIAELSGRLAGAQAEYYYDDRDTEGGDEDEDKDKDGIGGSKPEEWLWNMKWKARMRRLSFTSSKWQCPLKQGEKNTCESASILGGLSGADLQKLDGLKSMLSEGVDGIITH